MQTKMNPTDKLFEINLEPTAAIKMASQLTDPTRQIRGIGISSDPIRANVQMFLDGNVINIDELKNYKPVPVMAVAFRPGTTRIDWLVRDAKMDIDAADDTAQTNPNYTAFVTGLVDALYEKDGHVRGSQRRVIPFSGASIENRSIFASVNGKRVLISQDSKVHYGVAFDQDSNGFLVRIHDGTARLLGWTFEAIYNFVAKNSRSLNWTVIENELEHAVYGVSLDFNGMLVFTHKVEGKLACQGYTFKVTDTGIDMKPATQLTSIELLDDAMLLTTDVQDDTVIGATFVGRGDQAAIQVYNVKKVDLSPPAQRFLDTVGNYSQAASA